MVVVSPSKAWLHGMRVPGFGHHAGDGHLGRLHRFRHKDDGSSMPRHLGILAFEAARTMSRLVSLHRALSDAEVSRARATMRSPGVAYLNSSDQRRLLRLACAEMVDDVDAAAAAVARLGRRCRGTWTHGFEHVYADLKVGVGDIPRLGLGTHPKDVEKKVRKMEKYVASTSDLYVAMEGLAELEAGAQRQLGNWRQMDPFDALRKRLTQQRDRVRQLREESLWSRNFDKVAELMARSVVSNFARICSIYGAVVAELPPVTTGRHGRVEFSPRNQYYFRLCTQHHVVPHGVSCSGPLERPAMLGHVLTRNSGPILRFTPAKEAAADAKPWKERVLEAPADTLGASGLALLYAKVVVLVESLARSPGLVGGETREELYWMLPVGLRGAVTAKLRSHRKMDDGEGPSDALAGGWREAVEGILEWLAPMAQDTIQWHSERSFEQRQLDSGPRLLMLQTLMFSDTEKAEAAIVELLVAFSYVCRYRQEEEEGGISCRESSSICFSPN